MPKAPSKAAAKPKAAPKLKAAPKAKVVAKAASKTPAKAKAAPKRPRAAKEPKRGSPRAEVEAMLLTVRASLEDDKAEEIVVIDLEGKSSIADFMVVASGRSQRQVGAIADHLTERLHKAGLRNIRRQGSPQNDWVLVDSGDIVVHVFRPEVRDFYRLEKLWAGELPVEEA